jgi:putative two-component system response regulator
MQDALIMTMGLMAEARDSDTARHIKVTQQIALLLTKRMQEKGMHRQLLSDEYLTALFKTIPLHDVGKLGLPDRVLFKQGKLDQNEYALMRQHPQLGLEIIQSVEEFLGKPFVFANRKRTAYSHQERWDGQGYPQGLIADEIPSQHV